MNEDYLYNIIRDIENEKKSQKIFPSYASKNEIMSKIYEDMRRSLSKLLVDKRISYHATLNSWAVNTV